MCVPHHVYGFHQVGFLLPLPPILHIYICHIRPYNCVTILFFEVTPGGMAQYLLYPAKALVHVVPPAVHPHHAAFIEPLACSLHAVELGDIQWSDVVVVSGCGPLGLGMVAGAK